MSAALTLSFDGAQLKRLDKAAAERRISREELAQYVLAAFLESDGESEFEEWQLEKIREGQAAAERGEFASEAEVEQFFSQYR